VRSDYPTTAVQMERGVEAVREALAEAGIELEVVPGGELALEQAARLEPSELRRFGLGGNPRYLLVETPYYGWPLALTDRLFSLRDSGITPVLAHPERSAEVQGDPERLVHLVRGGVLVQVTAASLDGRIGKRPQQTARRLIEMGLAHLLASDAHSASIREVGMSAAARTVGGRLADWLTRQVPAAIVDGTPLPPRPETPSGGRLRRLFR